MRLGVDGFVRMDGFVCLVRMRFSDRLDGELGVGGGGSFSMSSYRFATCREF